ncbi:MAG: hypothetical protein O2910_08615 [Proteobacteria bacterium]|nr:hypothetical protein [Pseudomonadota bacterium]
MKRLIILGLAIFLLAIPFTNFGQALILGYLISQSHIDANVPSSKDFDAFFRRDLEAYFTLPPNYDVKLEYELLRDGPTQTGLAFPKFYAWVWFPGDQSHRCEGACPPSGH